MADRRGIRWRLASVALAILIVGGSGVVLDRVVGARAIGSGAVEGSPTGAWYCPHGGAPGWQAWVVLANPGPSEVRIRMTQLTRGRVRSVTSFAVASVRQVYRPVSGQDPSDATVLEFFGGWVAAAAVIRSTSPPGIAAERCEAAPRRTWFMLDETTGPGDTAFVIVMNPFAADAAFDLVIRTEGRSIAPSPLSPYVLKARSSVAFRLNDYALEGPEEHTVTAQVSQRIGRVVAGGLVQSSGGIRAEAGSTQPARTTVLPAGGFVGDPDLILFDPGRDRADLTVTSSGRTGQQVVSGAEPVSLAPDEVKTVTFPDFPGAGTAVQSDNQQPVVAAVRVRGPLGDPATLAGSVSASRAWLVLPSMPPDGGKAFLILQNPGRVGLRLSVQLIGRGGPVDSRRLSAVLLPPGRTLSLILPGGARGAPVAALVRAESGTFVAAGASYGRNGGGYALTLGLPMKGA